MHNAMVKYEVEKQLIYIYIQIILKVHNATKIVSQTIFIYRLKQLFN